jgi:hypothetical protein
MALPDGYDFQRSILTGMQNRTTDNSWDIVLTNGSSLTLGATTKLNGVYLLTDGANAMAFIIINSTTVTLGPATASQTTIAVTDAGTAVRFYNSSGSLVIKNSVGADRTFRLTKVG